MTDHDLAPARQAIEGLLTDEQLEELGELIEFAIAQPGGYDAARKFIADALAPAWAEMQRKAAEAERDALRRVIDDLRAARQTWGNVMHLPSWVLLDLDRLLAAETGGSRADSL